MDKGGRRLVRLVRLVRLGWLGRNPPRDSRPLSPATWHFTSNWATGTRYFWWCRKRVDLFWFGINTIINIILK